jgi:hypothetical protein
MLNVSNWNWRATFSRIANLLFKLKSCPRNEGPYSPAGAVRDVLP